MRWILWIWILAGLPTLAWGDPELEVRDARWGFDGKKRFEAFNLLTLQVHNPSNEPYQGFIRLNPILGTSSVGLAEEQRISVAPGGSRTVQFTPFLKPHGAHDWEVRWQGGSNRLAQLLSDQDASGLATVKLRIGEQSSGNFASFPPEQFPTNVSATSTLGALFVGADPQWGAARADTFLQWLRRGGHLHLCQDATGEDIRFQGSLAVLNDSNVRSLGHGIITRHAKRLRDFSRSDAIALTPSTTQAQLGAIAQPRNQAFRGFGLTTLPDIPWPWIYAGAVLYLCLVGPGHYFFARNSRRDYRLILSALLLLVVGFSFLFSYVGRRGFGEADRWVTGAIATSLDDGTYDVHQWSHAFVTKGASYTFRYPSKHQLVDVDHEVERVPGILLSGPGGAMQLDLPRYSSRNLVSQALLRGPDIDVELHQWTDPFEGRVEASIRTEVIIRKAYCVQDDTLYRMELQGANRWVSGQPIRNWKTSHRHPNHASYRDAPWESLNHDLPNWLLARLGHERSNDRDPHGNAEIWLLTDLPEQFRPASPTFESYHGQVLYRFPLAADLLAPFN